MKKYYKTRIVHIPVYKRYEVELKAHWYSPWKEIDSVSYVKKGDCNSYSNSQEQAFSIAKKWADSFLLAEIVYPVENK